MFAISIVLCVQGGGRGGGVQFSNLFAYVLNVTLLSKKIEELSSTFQTWVMGHVT